MEGKKLLERFREEIIRGESNIYANSLNIAQVLHETWVISDKLVFFMNSLCESEVACFCIRGMDGKCEFFSTFEACVDGIRENRENIESCTFHYLCTKKKQEQVGKYIHKILAEHNTKIEKWLDLHYDPFFEEKRFGSLSVSPVGSEELSETSSEPEELPRKYGILAVVEEGIQELNKV